MGNVNGTVYMNVCKQIGHVIANLMAMDESLDSVGKGTEFAAPLRGYARVTKAQIAILRDLLAALTPPPSPAVRIGEVVSNFKMTNPSFVNDKTEACQGVTGDRPAHATTSVHTDAGEGPAPDSPSPAVPLQDRKAGDVHDECLDASETDRRRQQDESSAQAVTGGSHPVEQHASPAEGVAPPLERRERAVEAEPLDGSSVAHGRAPMRATADEGGFESHALSPITAREAQLAAELVKVKAERDAYRAAALRCETENGTHCPEDRSCGETIEALKAQLAALRPYVQHTPGCASRCCVCGYWRTVHRFSYCAEFQSKPCSCGLASILDPPGKETA